MQAGGTATVAQYIQERAEHQRAAIIVLDTLGGVSSYGAQAFTWLVVMVVFFLVPYGLITAELGTAFAEEGGPYVWVKLAFGRLAAAVVAIM